MEKQRIGIGGIELEVLKSFFIFVFYVCLSVSLFYWAIALKGMWWFGQFTMIEPNKYISFTEFVIGTILASWGAIQFFKAFYKFISIFWE